jgi:hypothetical protein
MLEQIIAIAVVAGFAGIFALGHVLVFKAVFASNGRSA